MQLKRKIAQLICIEVRMNELEKTEDIERIKKSVKDNQWGSIILFDGDIEKSAKLIAELQELSEIPLFVCCDLERGTGQHFKGATNIPSNMAVAATNNLDLAYKAGKMTAQEAKELGINVVFAPSVDVNNNPDNPIINIRSYGENPIHVADMAQAFINGCQIEGVIATAKHFPGHGDVSVDSHIKMPLIKKSKKALESLELFPFKQVINNDVAAIMTAHISVPSLDKSNTPATLSKPVITDLLRNKMGFNGLIITDALIMGGSKNQYEQSQEIMAILAGCDMLLMPPDPIKALEEINKAIENGIISEEIIDNANNRIQLFKEKFSIENYKKDIKRINTEKNKNIAKLIARGSLTKIKAKTKLPLNNDRDNILNLIIDQDDDHTRWNMYSCKLKKNHNVTTFSLDSKADTNTLKALSEKIQDKDTVIISFFSQIRAWKDNMYPDKEILNWLEENIISKKETIAITFSNPYFIKKIPKIKNYYCTYSDSLESQDAVIDMLFNDLIPNGISPVTLL